jgi:hypothetical protein
VFVFASAVEPSSPLSLYTRTSEYHLTDDGRFTLWYPFFATGYDGSYTEAEGVITFALSTYFATGLLRDGTLTVRYNLAAQQEGFEDAVYALRD